MDEKVNAFRRRVGRANAGENTDDLLRDGKSLLLSLRSSLNTENSLIELLQERGDTEKPNTSHNIGLFAEQPEHKETTTSAELTTAREESSILGEQISQIEEEIKQLEDQRATTDHGPGAG